MPANDPRLQRKLEALERRRIKRWTLALGEVMSTPAGRLVMWGLLRRAKVFESIFNTHGGIVNYNAGRQDFGHELIAELLALGDEPYLAMEREGRAADARDALEAESHQQESSQRTKE